MIGTTLDKYEVLQKVGEGGMATVYRGRHSTLERDVAIKVLHPHLSSSLRNRKRFEREAQAIEHLRHENILEIFDYSGMEGSDCYIVTEFVEGETLSGLLQRRGKLPSEVAAIVGVSVARALSYAHAQGILHRDIKTDNVMLRVDGTVKLMDFGIARFLDETKVTMTGALVGSPAFMSPEQAKEASLDQRSDLFALGTVLFDLVTGHLPFTGSNPSLILKNVIEGNRPNVAELAPTMSATLADVIERLMATDPEDRYNAAADVERHLLAALAEARIDPASPDWCLVAWLADPDGYEKRLEEHLARVLVEEGRRLLGAGDHLAALRLFNRLLSIDEDNAEVLALVQGLHGEPRAPSTRRTRWIAAGALGVVGLALGALYAVSLGTTRDPRAPETPTASTSTSPPLVAPTNAALVRDPGPAPVPVVPEAPVPPPAAVPATEPRPRAILPAVERPAPNTIERPSSAAPPLEEPRYAEVRLNTGDYVAEVFLRGTRLGDTRDKLALPPGTHQLTLRSPLLLEETVEVTVTGGETPVKNVTLRPKPSKVVFPDALPADCAVEANGRAVGTLAELGRAWVVERPDQRLAMGITCPDGAAWEHAWAIVPSPEVRFPVAGGP